jgi:hypothetical protein
VQRCKNPDRRGFLKKTPKTKSGSKFPKWTKIKMSKNENCKIIFFFEKKNFRNSEIFVSAALLVTNYKSSEK